MQSIGLHYTQYACVTYIQTLKTNVPPEMEMVRVNPWVESGRVNFGIAYRLCLVGFGYFVHGTHDT